MGIQKLLFIDLNPCQSTTEKCRQIPRIIENSLPTWEIFLQTSNCTVGPIHSSPDIILLRPSQEQDLLEIICSLRKRWGNISIMCLLCPGWDTLSIAPQYILDNLDDFITCPCKDIEFAPRIKSLLNRKIRISFPSQTLEIKERLNIESLIGKNKSLLEAVRKIPLFAKSDAAVLLSGETGTGKELFARAIHYNSPRHGKPFIPVNCGALPDHLFENELFGHAKGAFTDARTMEKGLIAESEGGTLFLDEVDTLSQTNQIKLLRFLQDQIYRLIGSPKSIEANVRIIAATNTDLQNRIDAKLFRKDLYYRLNILSLSLPPLRERVDDIPLLADHFLARFANQYGREAVRISHDAIQKLVSYPWPGNIRELESVIQQALLLSSSQILNSEDIPILIRPSSAKSSEENSLIDEKFKLISEFERAYLTNLMIKHKGNVTHASKASGRDRRTIQRLLKKYGINRYTFRDIP